MMTRGTVKKEEIKKSDVLLSFVTMSYENWKNELTKIRNVSDISATHTHFTVLCYKIFIRRQIFATMFHKLFNYRQGRPSRLMKKKKVIVTR
jgi:hypothetical protein